MPKHYVLFTLNDLFLFRDLSEVERFLTESIHSEAFGLMIEKVKRTEPNADIFDAVTIDGVEWELHQSDPSEEQGLQFFYQ